MTAPHRSRSARRSTALAASLILAASFVLAVLPAAPASAAVIVRASGTSWSPSSVTISRGGTVRWKGVSGTHRLKSYGGGWTILHALPAGTSVSHTFNRTGTFRFFCTIHGYVSPGGVCSGMCGKVVVH